MRCKILGFDHQYRGRRILDFFPFGLFGANVESQSGSATAARSGLGPACSVLDPPVFFLTSNHVFLYEYHIPLT
jgi:hypothetical protein